MSDLMKVYCINLDRRPDRLEHMTEQFERLGIDFIRVPAVDGQDTEVRAAASDCKTGFTGKKLGAGAYACFQSHRRAWSLLLESGDSHAVMLEDDVLVSDGLSECLTDGFFSETADVVKIETFMTRVHLKAENSCNRGPRQLKRLITGHMGAGGYILSSGIARALLKQTETIAVPVDHFLFNPISIKQLGLQVYQMTPAPVAQGDRILSDSAQWAESSITSDRFVSDQDWVATNKRSLSNRLRCRLREEIRAIRQGTRYAVVPFG